MKGVSWKVSLIKHKATGFSASLLYVLWVPFFGKQALHVHFL